MHHLFHLGGRETFLVTANLCVRDEVQRNDKICSCTSAKTTKSNNRLYSKLQPLKLV